TKWIELGAPWPADAAATIATAAAAFDLTKRKAEHWCWQPIKRPPVPSVQNSKSKIQNPIDSFVLEKLEARGLSSAPPAEARTLIRRANFDLIGLPPTAEELEKFSSSFTPSTTPPLSHSKRTEGESGRVREWESSYAAHIDRLLASPHFGERWARHWLDLVRYAESRGHEFDYNIPNAFEYRDYVIRPLNADVPYD